MTDAETPQGEAGAQIRVAIVDDHPVLRDGLASLLDGEPDLAIVATGATPGDAARLLASPDVDVLVLDVRLGQASGFESLADAEQEPSRPAVVVLTAFDYPQYAQAALRLGASAFVLKSAPMTELLGAIRRAAVGGLTFSKRPGPSVSLTRRELEVIRLVCEGRSNDEIATALGIAPRPSRPTFARSSSDTALLRERSSRRGRSGRAGLSCPCHRSLRRSCRRRPGLGRRTRGDVRHV